MSTTKPFPATANQLKLIRQLIIEGREPAKLAPALFVLAQRAQTDEEFISKKEASGVIEGLLAQKPKQQGQAQPPKGVMPGMYRDLAGAIYKVQRSKTGHLYAKRLKVIGGQRLTEAGIEVNFEFEYAPGAVRSLVPEQRMSIEEAKAFGIRYGVCCVCGRFLKDAASVAAGIGPICAKGFAKGDWVQQGAPLNESDWHGYGVEG